MSDQFSADVQVPETTTSEPPNAPATAIAPADLQAAADAIEEPSSRPDAPTEAPSSAAPTVAANASLAGAPVPSSAPPTVMAPKEEPELQPEPADRPTPAEAPSSAAPAEEPPRAAPATVIAPKEADLQTEVIDPPTGAAITEPSPADAPAEAASSAAPAGEPPRAAPATVIAPKEAGELIDPPTVAADAVTEPSPADAPAEVPSIAAQTVAATASPAASRSPFAVPAEIIQYAPPATRAILQALFRRPPIIAGQNIGEYFEIVRLLVDECAPISFEACFYIRTMADSLWKITTHQDVERCLFNAEVMDGLLQLEIDKAGEKGYNLGGDISLQRAYRVYFFRAVCGDERTKKELEEKFGFATVGLTAYTAKQTVLNIRAHAFVDGAIRVALGQYERAAKRLHELDGATRKQKKE